MSTDPRAPLYQEPPFEKAPSAEELKALYSSAPKETPQPVDSDPTKEPLITTDSGGESNPSGAKGGEVVENAENGDLGGPRQAHGATLPPGNMLPNGNTLQPADNQALTDDSTIPLSPKEIRNHTSRLIEKVQYLALAKLEKLLLSLENNSSTEELTNIIMKLADLKLTHEWTKRLEDAITKNSSLLSIGKNQPTLQKLQSFVTRTRKVAAGDGREGGKRMVSLPPDE